MFAERQVGGLRPTRGEIGATAIAGSKFAATRDLPDPLAWADFAADRAATASAVNSHVRAGLYPQPIELFPLPKPGRSDVRWLSDLHPYDELTLRVLVGRIAASIAAHVDRSIVFSAELAGRSPGLSLIHI